MSQHDYDIANQSFPAFRTDLNNVLGAINTSNSGTSRPSGAVAGTIWLDTSGGVTAYLLKFFDGTDDITMGTINTTANTINFSDSALDLITDTTPQLGGDLDVNGNAFVSTSNGDIEFTPNGTGVIKFNDLAYIPQQALTSSSNAIAWDVQAKPNAYHLTTEATTFSAPTNPVEGAFICVEIEYGGVHTIAWNTVFEFAASTAPTFTSVSGQTDIMVFKYNGAVWQEVGRTLNMSAT
jgi:hypothetical protein